MRNYYVPGDWNAVCQRCGFTHKASQLKEEWTGVIVCRECWEPRHPQTLLRVPKDDPSVPWTSTEGTDVFIAVSSPLTTEDDSGAYLTFLLTESGTIIYTEG